jgi:hypothetical protein
MIVGVALEKAAFFEICNPSKNYPLPFVVNECFSLNQLVYNDFYP